VVDFFFFKVRAASFSPSLPPVLLLLLQMSFVPIVATLAMFLLLFLLRLSATSDTVIRVCMCVFVGCHLW
jgi:hypothetical protein